jgi:broad specificity phosphatase PhoE
MQAAGLGALIADLAIDRAVSSDLARARETAEIAIGSRDIPLEIDPLWREMRFGAWEGLTWTEIVARFPQVEQQHRTVPKFYTPPGGETFDEVCERVAAGLEQIAQRANAGDRVLVATHAGALHALLRVALGGSEAEALAVKFAPGTLTRLGFSQHGARVIDINRSPQSV